jgi:hypothetical protein
MNLRGCSGSGREPDAIGRGGRGLSIGGGAMMGTSRPRRRAIDEVLDGPGARRFSDGPS